MSRRSQAVPAATPQRRFLTLPEAASILGMSWLTLRDWGQRGKIQTYKFSGAVRISSDELDRIIAESERPRVA